jgi:hypothetical protein
MVEEGLPDCCRGWCSWAWEVAVDSEIVGWDGFAEGVGLHRGDGLQGGQGTCYGCVVVLRRARDVEDVMEGLESHLGICRLVGGRLTCS